MSTENLFDDFQKISSEEWLKQIEKDLRGKDFNSLLSHTADGIIIQPTYQDEALVPHQSFRKNKSWNTVQEILVMDSKEANKKALDHLNRGANALLFYLSPNFNLEQLLSDIQIEYIDVHFVVEGQGENVLNQLKKLVDQRGLSHESITGSINIDTLENLARTGNWFNSEEEDLVSVKNIKQESFPNFKTICVNANLFANAGATIGQQLGIGLAMAYEYVHQLELKDGKGFWFNFAVGSDYFGEIAKLRAFRRLWSNLQIELNLEEKPAHIYCETATRNKTILDAYNNMIRTSTEAMSAIIGGCDELSIKGFNVAFDEAGDFSERIAKNQQAILQYESHLSAVKDMAKGSHFIETLTEKLAEIGWSFFKEIEAQGGYISVLKSGWFQGKVKESADKEQKAFDAKEKTLIGANKYQKADENLKEIIRHAMFYKANNTSTAVEPVQVKRLSEELEK